MSKGNIPAPKNQAELNQYLSEHRLSVQFSNSIEESSTGDYVWRVEGTLSKDIDEAEEICKKEIAHLSGYYLPSETDQLEIADSISGDVINSICAILDLRHNRNEQQFKPTIRNTALEKPFKTDPCDYNIFIVDDFGFESEDALKHFLNLYDTISTGIPNGYYDLISVLLVRHEPQYTRLFRQYDWNVIADANNAYAVVCQVRDIWG